MTDFFAHSLFHFGKSIPLSWTSSSFMPVFLQCVFGLYNPCPVTSALLCIFEVLGGNTGILVEVSTVYTILPVIVL